MIKNYTRLSGRALFYLTLKAGHQLGWLLLPLLLLLLLKFLMFLLYHPCNSCQKSCQV